MGLHLSGTLGERTALDTEPRISRHRKAISERFRTNLRAHKSPRKHGFCPGIALRCDAGLGSLARRAGTANAAESTRRMLLASWRIAMSDTFPHAHDTPETLPFAAASPYGRPSWSGLLQFSLVGIPLKAYPAVRTRDL